MKSSGVPIGAYGVQRGQALQGEAWLGASHAWLRDRLPVPTECFPRCRGSHAGVLFIRMLDGRWVIAWSALTSQGRGSRLQTDLRVAVVAPDQLGAVAPQIAEELRQSPADLLSARSALDVRTCEPRASRRRLLAWMLGMVHARRAASGDYRLTRVPTLAPESDLPWTDLVVLAAWFAEQICRESGVVVYSRVPEQAEDRSFQDCGWGLMLAPAFTTAASLVHGTSAASGPAAPTSFSRYSSRLRGVTIEELQHLDDADFDGLLRPPHEDAGTAEERIRIPLRLLSAVDMSHDEWQEWSRLLRAAPDQQLSRTVASLESAGQDDRLVELCSTHAARPGIDSVARKLLRTLGLTAEEVDGLVALGSGSIWPRSGPTVRIHA